SRRVCEIDCSAPPVRWQEGESLRLRRIVENSNPAERESSQGKDEGEGARVTFENDLVHLYVRAGTNGGCSRRMERCHVYWTVWNRFRQPILLALPSTIQWVCQPSRATCEK